MSEVIDAILPAGGKLSPEFAEQAGTNVKALVEIGGKTFLQAAIDAVKESGVVRNLVVIGGEGVQTACASQGIETLPEAATGPDNMFNGLEHLCKSSPPPDRVMLVMTDLPLIRGEDIRWMIENGNTGKDIYLAAVREQDFLTAYPGCPSTFVSLVGEKLTLGGLILLRPEAMKKARPHIRSAFEQRKSKVGLAKLLGFGFTIKFLMKKVTVQNAEDKIVSLLGCTGSPLLGAPPTLAFDVDDIFDLNYTKKILADKN